MMNDVRDSFKRVEAFEYIRNKWLYFYFIKKYNFINVITCKV